MLTNANTTVACILTVLLMRDIKQSILADKYVMLTIAKIIVACIVVVVGSFDLGRSWNVSVPGVVCQGAAASGMAVEADAGTASSTAAAACEGLPLCGWWG